MPDRSNASDPATTSDTPDTPDTPESPGDRAERAREAEPEAERRRRRAVFLRELNEAKALRERVRPRHARAARMRQHMRMRTFRW